MKKLECLLLFAAICCSAIPSAFAQGDSFSCPQCVCAADAQCYAEQSCSGSTLLDCSSTTFVAECTAAYALRAVMSCSDGALCKYCYACVRLFSGQTVIGVCHNTCQGDQCLQECTSAAFLTQGQTYTLYVGLRSCVETGCSECQCTARGYVYRQWSDCNTIPSCNP